MTSKGGEERAGHREERQTDAAGGLAGRVLHGHLHLVVALERRCSARHAHAQAHVTSDAHTGEGLGDIDGEVGHGPRVGGDGAAAGDVVLLEGLGALAVGQGDLLEQVARIVIGAAPHERLWDVQGKRTDQEPMLSTQGILTQMPTCFSISRVSLMGEDRVEAARRVRCGERAGQTD